MQKVYVPYTNDSPAAVEINGHRVLIVCAESDDFVSELSLPTNTEIRELEIDEDEAEQSEVLAELAADISGGVVFAPEGISLQTMIASLEQELPWVH